MAEQKEIKEPETKEPEIKEITPQKIDITTSQIVSFSEVGTRGLFRQGGYVYEEFLSNLRWPQATKIYKEMSSNDPTIGAILYMAEQLIKKATWRVQAGGTEQVDLEAGQFLTECIDDMSSSWADTISEILSMLTYGWSWHEIVYKKRDGDVKDPTHHSKFKDGRIGWRKLAARGQNTLKEWVFDDTDGGILAMIQQPAPDWDFRTIPIKKSLLFRTKVERNNPEGRSLLRNAYRPWYFKKHIEEIEGIGIERDLAGLPVLVPPDGVDIWNPADAQAQLVRNQAEKLVRNVRRDQSEGLVIPFGWDFKLMNSGGSRQFDTNAVLNRYDQRIAITLLSDIVMLGADKVGSFALANVKKSLLSASLEAQLDNVADVINRYGVPRLFSYNTFQGLTAYPKLVHGEVETPDLKELGEYVSRLSGAGMPLFPDVDLEAYLRQVASMPENTKNTAVATKKSTPSKLNGDESDPDEGNEEGEDGKKGKGEEENK